ncbi:hypothetical protein F443_09269 [Phytophthora nicotianae P1569]|uniref:Uncharacterized protein n=1 Tax=Phytophthora nicotianae P1569 TaxID=1317065 RepID=V9F493_PHYNI|nr:hypothetical protein F443_09269 [Phytophthora nicotianae P1569]
MQTEDTSFSDASHATEVLEYDAVGSDADLQRSSLSYVDMPSARGSVEEDLDIGDHSAVDFVSNATETVIAVADPIGNDVGDKEKDLDSSLDYGRDIDEGAFTSADISNLA